MVDICQTTKATEIFDDMLVMWRLSLSVANNEAPTLTSITDPCGDYGGPFVQIAPPLSVRFRASNTHFLSLSACLCLALCCAVPLHCRFVLPPFFLAVSLHALWALVLWILCGAVSGVIDVSQAVRGYLFLL